MHNLIKSFAEDIQTHLTLSAYPLTKIKTLVMDRLVTSGEIEVESHMFGGGYPTNDADLVRYWRVRLGALAFVASSDNDEILPSMWEEAIANSRDEYGDTVEERSVSWMVVQTVLHAIDAIRDSAQEREGGD